MYVDGQVAAYVSPETDAAFQSSVVTGGGPMRLTGNVTLCGRSDLDPLVSCCGQLWPAVACCDRLLSWLKTLLASSPTLLLPCLPAATLTQAALPICPANWRPSTAPHFCFLTARPSAGRAWAADSPARRCSPPPCPQRFFTGSLAHLFIWDRPVTEGKMRQAGWGCLAYAGRNSRACTVGAGSRKAALHFLVSVSGLGAHGALNMCPPRPTHAHTLLPTRRAAV